MKGGGGSPEWKSQIVGTISAESPKTKLFIETQIGVCFPKFDIHGAVLGIFSETFNKRFRLDLIGSH
jgi:hypothetical protein